jgi:hypothetical protein
VRGRGVTGRSAGAGAQAGRGAGAGVQAVGTGAGWGTSAARCPAAGAGLGGAGAREGLPSRPSKRSAAPRLGRGGDELRYLRSFGCICPQSGR